MSQCVPPWVYPVWDSLCFLDLDGYFLSHTREVFNCNLLRYFLRPFLFLLLLCCAVFSHCRVQLFVTPPGSSVPGDSPGKNTGVGCHALLQGIFPTQGSNPGLLYCRRILYCLNHQGSPVLFWDPSPSGTSIM